MKETVLRDLFTQTDLLEKESVFILAVSYFSSLKMRLVSLNFQLVFNGQFQANLHGR